MSKVFVIGDLHLGYEKVGIWRGFGSTKEHDACIIENWNEVVRSKRDCVWVLGDVAFSKQSLALLKYANGYKKLVLGNHDMFPMSEYMKYFSKIFGAVQYNGDVLTHIPVHEGQFGRYKRNIHGHLHGNALEDNRYVCVSAERTGLRPVELDSLG
jgi:Predicted phosphoesterase or phosphohydrolase